MSDRFNDDTRQVLRDSLRVALSLGHNYIRPEHILLALIRQEDGITTRALDNIDVTRATLRKGVIEAIRDDLQPKETPP